MAATKQITQDDFKRFTDTIDRWRVTMQVQIDKHNKTLYGNGEPGIDEQIRNIHLWMEAQKEKDRKRVEWWNKLQWIIIPIVITGFFAFVGQAVYFYFDLIPKLQNLP